jgi:predicted dehydrogenase
MLELFEPIAAAAAITVPESPLPVAVIGAGAIADFAHLPAYTSAGIPVVGIYDIDHERAGVVARRHGIPRVYTTSADLFADSQVDIVDIAVVPQSQPELVRSGIRARKHLMCQKPFTLDLPLGRTLQREGNAAGVRIAVQQQMRYEEGIAAARAMVDSGWIGEVTNMTISVNISTDWGQWPWLVASERLDLMYHSIHYMDSIRSILGDPVTVFSTGQRTPGQHAAAETRTISTLVFPRGVTALVAVNHENRAGDAWATYRIDGHAGAIRGTLGLLYDYPHGRPDTLEVFSSVIPTDGWLAYPVTQRWLPDAFAGPMASLQTWVLGGPPAPTRLDDNLRTLDLVDALYRSADTGSAVHLPLDAG